MPIDLLHPCGESIIGQVGGERITRRVGGEIITGQVSCERITRRVCGERITEQVAVR